MPRDFSRWSAQDSQTQPLAEQIAHLEAVKDQLLKEVEFAEERLRWSGAPDNFIIPTSQISGFNLTGFYSSSNGNLKTYSAECHQLFFSMQVTVSVEDTAVLGINLSISDMSPLNEIRSDLIRISQGLCPYNVLLVIQQFANMTEFRSKVAQGLNSNNFFFQFLNDYAWSIGIYQNNGDGQTISAIGEMHWRILWNTTYQSLVHQFCFNKVSPIDQQEHTFVQSLVDKVHHFSEEETLMQLWCQLNEWVTTSSSPVLET